MKLTTPATSSKPSIPMIIPLQRQPTRCQDELEPRSQRHLQLPSPAMRLQQEVMTQQSSLSPQPKPSTWIRQASPLRNLKTTSPSLRRKLRPQEPPPRRGKHPTRRKRRRRRRKATRSSLITAQRQVARQCAPCAAGPATPRFPGSPASSSSSTTVK